jgi:hypothetical protein
MAKNTAGNTQTTGPSQTRVPPAPQIIGAPASPQSIQHGPGYSREPQTNVNQTPGTSRSGGLPADTSAPRTITRNAPDATNRKTIDRASIDQATYADHYG